jgi:hypothetical protein
MEVWSDNPIHKEFTAKIFLDTNILVYLMDGTYPSLSAFINLAKDSPFCELVCSRYVMFEFVGIRKREHYLRKVASNSKKSTKGEINFSSLINQKFINTFSAQEVDFAAIVGDMKKDVEEEIDKITRDFGIDFSYSVLHEDQLMPTFDICLSSKISNQDSLVLISSILPTKKDNAKGVVVFTHDNDFATFFNNNDVIDALFQKHSLIKPKLKIISDVGNNINLKNDLQEAQLRTCFETLILSIIESRNSKNYLGRTFAPANANFPDDCVCFKLVETFALSQSTYVTIIGKNLDFIYTVKKKVSFWQNGQAVAAGFVSPAAPADRINISFKVIEVDDNGQDAIPSNSVTAKLKSEGNYIFIHPDSQL